MNVLDIKGHGALFKKEMVAYTTPQHEAVKSIASPTTNNSRVERIKGNQMEPLEAFPVKSKDFKVSWIAVGAVLV